jgi:hypothetical protein
MPWTIPNLLLHDKPVPLSNIWRTATMRVDPEKTRRLISSGGCSRRKGNPVLEIEREAREAGLLGPDSPISQNKSFRSAREILGVIAQRKGGAAAKGQWVWVLPDTPKMPSKRYDAPFFEEGTLDTSGAS